MMHQQPPLSPLPGEPAANRDGFACPLCGSWLSAEQLDNAIGQADRCSPCGHLWGRAVAHYVGEDGRPVDNPLAGLVALIQTRADDLLPDAATRALAELYEAFQAALFGHFTIVRRAVGGRDSGALRYYPFAASPREALDQAARAERACWARLGPALSVLPNPFREERQSWADFEAARKAALDLGNGDW
jgi:hypothetical protein